MKAQRRYEFELLRAIGNGLLVLALALNYAFAGGAQNTNELKEIEYARVGDKALYLDLYRPDNVTDNQRVPVVIWVHGGAWRSGSKSDVPIKRLLHHGFAIASVDYRLSPEAPFPAQVHDIKGAIRFVRKHASTYRLDPDRVVIAGSSAGGHLAALVGVSASVAALEGNIGDALKEPTRVQAIVSFYGAGNLQTILAQSTPHGLKVRVPALQLFLGGQPDEVPEIAALASPVRHVEASDPPLILIHGDQDPQMPVNQSLEMQAVYQQNNLNVQLNVVHGGVHGGKGFFEDTNVDRIAANLTALISNPNSSKVPMPVTLLSSGARLETAATVCFLEGPAIDAANNLFVSDIAGNRILKIDPQGNFATFRSDSGRTNGNTFDALGRLISCEGTEMGANGRRRVVRTDLATGQVTVLTERYEGKRYNSPNDVVVDPRGRIWFTDPLYAPDRSIMEHEHEAVYRIDVDGSVHRVITQPAIGRPNGIAVSPNGRTLYLVDSNYIRPDGNRKIWAFDIAEDGSVQRQRQIYDFGRGRGGDGMRLDVDGNLWVAAGIHIPRTANETADVQSGVYVISPNGELRGRIPIPEDVITNLAFGGPDKRTLYVTAGKSLFKIATNVSGYSLYPERK